MQAYDESFARDPMTLRLARPQHRSSSNVHSKEDDNIEDANDQSGTEIRRSTNRNHTEQNSMKKQRPSYVGGVNILNNASYRKTISEMPKAISIDNFDFSLDGMSGVQIIRHMVEWAMGASKSDA